MARIYSIRKSRKILRSHYALFKRKHKRLPQADREEIEADLRELDAALLAKDRERASKAARLVQQHGSMGLRRTFLDVTRDLFCAIVFAVVVAFVIRQFWFELYQVPTGSMRPTIEEQDRLLVSKTTFGVNFPFHDKLTFFREDRIQRNGIIVLTTANMDLPDSNMLYFGIFPGKKRFVKRCCSRPGDTLYFYGGRIYGFDKDGVPFYELSDEKILAESGIEKIEHIPFITFEGKPSLKKRLSNGIYGEVITKQMNLPVAKMELKPDGVISGSFFDGMSWKRENLRAVNQKHSSPQAYSELWGMGNYAMCRILTREELKKFYHRHGEAELYLELRHTPNMQHPKPQVRQSDSGKYFPQFTPFVSLIPLDQRHLDILHDAMITARFHVKEGAAFRYVEGNRRPQRREFDPKFPKVSNGLYEFYYGKGYRIFPLGVQTPMSAKNGLYERNAATIQKLFNLGFAFNTLYDPHLREQPFMPSRYAYWRDGELYVMGAPLLKKDDPALSRFVEEEKKREEQSRESLPYVPFIDRGPPLLQDGSLDIEFVRQFGLKVPDNALVALGDNYAGSADSRDFGFVPMHNLRGAPSFIFWPPGKRLGPLAQPPYPWITLPNLLIWSLAAVVITLCTLIVRRRNSRSIFRN
ncbi:MAG: hypothetical protein S4CHLAM81_00440 [Chlamydiales bacterium]|nr:hypothetical protein [Chlamydiales bacterium]MCH9634846.1 hypothetical protein [Chlamydiales bacterium]